MKRLLRIVLLVSAFMLYAIPPLAAQDELTCDAATLKSAVDTFIGALGGIRDETDPAVMSETLQELANTANTLRAACDGLSFADNNQAVFGPVEFPAGTYIATFTTDGYGIIDVSPIDDGACGQGTGTRYSTNLFLVSGGEAVDGAETVFGSEGCTALIEVSNVQGDWSLTFERLTSGT